MPATFRSSTLRRYRDIARDAFLVTCLADFTYLRQKGAIWRQQQPASTTTALFIDKFKLNATQLLELLEAGVDSSTELDAERDQIACTWLNDNTGAWEGWLPEDTIYETFLARWKLWLIVCGLCFFGVFWVEPNFDLLYRTCSERRARKLESNAQVVPDGPDITATEVTLVKYALGQIFVQATKGFVEVSE